MASRDLWPAPVSVDERLFLGDEFLLRFVLLQLAQVALGFQDPILGEIAGEGVKAAVVQFPDLGGRLVQEIAVMGDNHYRRSEVGQVALQPDDSIDVKVVGGLVQHQQVRVAQ